MSYYLDVETGAVAMVSDETRAELEEIYAELDTGEDLDDVAVAEAIRQRNVADWEREALEEADRVEHGVGTRYIAVSRDDTHDAYRDMADFVATVMDDHLRERLADAIDGRGAFGRFKRVLSAHDEERSHWFAFRDARLPGCSPSAAHRGLAGGRRDRANHEAVSMLPQPDVAASSSSYCTLREPFDRSFTMFTMFLSKV